MAAQTRYGYSIPKGVPGGKVDISFDEVVTRNSEAEDGKIKFGMAVVKGTSAGTGVTVPASGKTVEDFEGVVLHHINTEQERDGSIVIKKGSVLSVMKKGHVWGRLASDATPAYGKKAYVVIDGTDAGTFTHTQGSNVDIGAKFGKESDDGIAVIEL